MGNGMVILLQQAIQIGKELLELNADQEKWEQHEQLLSDIDWACDELEKIILILKDSIDNDNKV